MGLIEKAGEVLQDKGAAEGRVKAIGYRAGPVSETVVRLPLPDHGKQFD